MYRQRKIYIEIGRQIQRYTDRYISGFKMILPLSLAIVNTDSIKIDKSEIDR